MGVFILRVVAAFFFLGDIRERDDNSPTLVFVEVCFVGVLVLRVGGFVGVCFIGDAKGFNFVVVNNSEGNPEGNNPKGVVIGFLFRFPYVIALICFTLLYIYVI